MPSGTLILEAILTAACGAAIVLLVGAWLRRWSADGPLADGPVAGASLAVAATAVGVAVGVAWLGARPHWPPREDQDRLLLIVWPLALLVEFVVAFLPRPRWLQALLRGATALACLPILLDGSVYFTELAGPGSREWSIGQILMYVLGFGAIVAGASLATRSLARRGTPASALASVCVLAMGCAVTVMLSGYASGGQLGFPVAGAIAAVCGAQLLLRWIDVTGAASFGVVASGTLLALGHCFGELPLAFAGLLFAAPFLGLLVELPPSRRWNVRFRESVRLVLMAAPVVGAIALAARRFIAASG